MSSAPPPRFWARDMEKMGPSMEKFYEAVSREKVTAECKAEMRRVNENGFIVLVHSSKVDGRVAVAYFVHLGRYTQTRDLCEMHCWGVDDKFITDQDTGLDEAVLMNLEVALEHYRTILPLLRDHMPEGMSGAGAASA